MSNIGQNQLANTGSTWDGVKWVSTYIAQASYYVDDISGSDSGLGTVGSPWKTMQKLFGVLRADSGLNRLDVVVNVSPHGGTGYDMTGFDLVKVGNGDLTFKGVGATQIQASMTLSSLVDEGELVFPAATFVDQARRGLFLECLTATNAINVGSSKTILRNTTTNVNIAFRADPATPFVAGDTFRVTEPAVVLLLNTPAIIGGAPDVVANAPSPALNFVNVILRNILVTSFRNTQKFSGNCRFFGVIIRNLFGREITFRDGTFLSGRRVSSGVDWSFLSSTFANGWGLTAMRDPSEDPTNQALISADLEFTNSRFFGNLVCIRCTLRSGCNLNITSGAFKATTAGSGALRNFSSTLALGPTFNAAIILEAETAAAAAAVISVSERGNTTIDTDRVKQISGTGGIICADSRMVFNGSPNQPVILGTASATGNGSVISLEGVDGSTVAGGFVVPNQTQATFATGELINGFGAQIYRPS